MVDAPDAVSRVKTFLGSDPQPVLVEHHSEPTEILEHYKVNAAIRDALKPRVDLPSGGYVIIEPTEALTVIDVNSGSFTRSANARETVLWTNYEAATEIARQLKLRNIGGVVIIDFIDMESRRDQLQLLEHFTSEVRSDSARPQIAQISELGLVELTRKRQGQNIYELFGRACPSCGGLGHVVVLPGQDTLQPLASVSGLVRSAASARAEASTPAALEGGSGGRRRGRGRGGRSSDGDSTTAYDDGAVVVSAQVDAAPQASSGSEGHNRRPEPELVAVPMEPDQELVYGWLGLNPALLLDPAPNPDNLMVRVVRPGQDAEAVLDEARQQLAAAGPRRRRRGRGGNSANGAASAPAPVPVAQTEPMGVAITPLPTVSITEVALTDSPVTTVSITDSTATTASQDEAAPARTGRTRTRSRSSAAATSVAVTEAPAATVAVVSAPPAEEAEDNGEPRRRRRRSSASD